MSNQKTVTERNVIYIRWRETLESLTARLLEFSVNKGCVVTDSCDYCGIHVSWERPETERERNKREKAAAQAAKKRKAAMEKKAIQRLANARKIEDDERTLLAALKNKYPEA